MAITHQASASPKLDVLIADDDPPTRILLRAAITQWGYHVIAAPDGEAAWDILQHPNAPKLLILDWLMPKLNGIDLCAKIKKEMAFKPYIILLTQVTGTENIVKGLEAGADEFLSKPFNMAELNSRLSVGARIVNFGMTVTAQNAQLQQIRLLVQAIRKSNPSMQDTVEFLLQHAPTLLQSGPLDQHIENLKAVQTDLASLAELVDDLAPTHKEHD